MKLAKPLGLLFSVLAACLGGCGNYTVVFEVEEVINTDANEPRNDNLSQMLDVDIVCITSKSAQEHQGILDGTLRSDAWFKARDAGELKIPRKHIISLKKDSPAGEPILSGRLMSGDAPWTREVKFHMPDALSSGSAIVFYGKFRKGSGVSNAEPVVIKPPPAWNMKIRIAVGRTRMDLIEDE